MSRGTLTIIGGREDKDGDCRILRRFAETSGQEDAVIGIIAAAASRPGETAREYRRVFAGLGVLRVEALEIKHRRDANDDTALTRLADCTGVFFTGGDQLRLMGLLAGTRLDRDIRTRFVRGLHIAGTSAGASVMSDTMIVGGADDDPPKKCTIKLAPGLGLIREAVVDQHFAERGRIGRLLSTVAQGPHVLGIGIDEDTALILYSDNRFRVCGSQTVTVIDARPVTMTNASERQQDEPLAVTDVLMHVLPDGYGYDLVSRQPLERESE